MRLELAVLGAAAIIAASILFIGRWQISAVGLGYGYDEDGYSSETVYRLDRWTGEIDTCLQQRGGFVVPRMDRLKGTLKGETYISCSPPIVIP